MSDDVTTTDPTADKGTPESANPMGRMSDAELTDLRTLLDAESAAREPEPEPEPEPVGTADHWRVAFLPDSSQRLVYVGPDTDGTDGPNFTATHGRDTLPAGSRIADPTPAP